MTTELPREIETKLKKTARAQGVSVGQYVERLVAETSIRSAERMASLNSGNGEVGERSYELPDCRSR